MNDIKDDICRILEENRIQVSDEEAEKLGFFMKLVLEKNKSLNLTGITEQNEFILKHIADSLTLLPFIPKGAKKLIDIGTGAGFPGMPIAIMRPDLEVTLLDSTKKKIAFLEDAVAEMKLPNVSAIAERAETICANQNYKARFDIATARAVTFLPDLLAYALPFLKTGGLFLAQKSENKEELEAAESALKISGGKIKEIAPITIGGFEKRCLIVIQKT